MIRTVLGDVPASLFGHTQCHEHLFIKKGVSYQINQALCIDNEEKTADELLAYRSAGGKSIVDAQPVFCGRMADSLMKVSQKTDVNIVATTGFHKTIFYDKDSPIFSCSEIELADIFASEIKNGMIDSSIKTNTPRAGIIKIALDENGTDSTYRKLQEAVFDAAKSTGAPVLVHTDKNTDPLALIEKLTRAGIESNRVIVCHLCRTNDDLTIHRDVLSTGAYLCYDSINRLKYIGHEKMIDLIIKMLESGYENNLLISLDTTNERLRSYGGYMGLDYILTVYKNMLLTSGVSEEIYNKLTVFNTAKALAF